MRSMGRLVALMVLMSLVTSPARAQWAAPKAPAVPDAPGWVVIPDVAMAPEPQRVYKAVWDAKMLPAPDKAIPALTNAGAELNAFALMGVPAANVHFVVVFHNVATSAVLDNEHYKATLGTDNPNLKLIAALRRAGVTLYVCGQNLASKGIDPSWVNPDVTVASDGLIALMTLQNEGYALLSF